MMTNFIQSKIKESIDVKEDLLKDLTILQNIEKVSKKIIQTFRNDGKILLCGNGGSAADAQHLAAEFSGRFNFDRYPLDAEALHVNTSYLTAVANDYSYEEVYSRLIKAKGKSGDVLIGLSTSGNSENIIRALREAKSKGLFTVGLTGISGGKMENEVDILIRVPSNKTPRIQESHILIGHIICEMVEDAMFI